MNEPQHPLTLSEILDRTAQLYRARFLVFLGIATIPAGIVFTFAAAVFAFIAWMGNNARHGAPISDVLMWVFLILLTTLIIPVSLAASALGNAAISEAAARAFLGEAGTIRSAYATAFKRLWRYAGLYTLLGLVILGAPLVLFSVAVAGMIFGKVNGYAANDPSPLFGGLIFLLLLVLGALAVWMLLRFCLAFPVSVVEQAPAWSALKRGALLSHGTRARILLLYVLGLVLNQVLAIGFTVPALVVMAFIPGLQGQAHAQAAGMVAMFVVYGSYFAVRALVKPIYGIALTLFYFDQRIRKEGFDIEWMMQQAGMVPLTQSAAEIATTSPLQATSVIPDAMTDQIAAAISLDEAATHERTPESPNL
jgi:hypothetical protein